MNSYDKKLQQIRLQHQIVGILKNDNGVSCHFDYHINMMSDDETIKLNLLTYNPAHENYMLLHSTSGKSSIHCLERMQTYLTEFYNPKFLYSFTIEWKKKDDPAQQSSVPTILVGNSAQQHSKTDIHMSPKQTVMLKNTRSATEAKKFSVIVSFIDVAQCLR